MSITLLCLFFCIFNVNATRPSTVSYHKQPNLAICLFSSLAPGPSFPTISQGQIMSFSCVEWISQLCFNSNRQVLIAIKQIYFLCNMERMQNKIAMTHCMLPRHPLPYRVLPHCPLPHHTLPHHAPSLTCPPSLHPAPSPSCQAIAHSTHSNGYTGTSRQPDDCTEVPRS